MNRCQTNNNNYFSSITVKAYKITRDNFFSVIEWIGADICEKFEWFSLNNKNCFFSFTGFDKVIFTCYLNDYIVKTIDNDFFCIKQEVFDLLFHESCFNFLEKANINENVFDFFENLKLPDFSTKEDN